MHRHFSEKKHTIHLFFEDEEIEVPAGLTVAAAVYAHTDHTRLTDKHKAQRAPFCHMGICFECLMRVNGKDNQQACMTTVQEGMRIYRQAGRREF